MEKKAWKTLAIIFIVLFIAILLFNIWAVTLANNEEKQKNICYYDVCSEYPDAYLENDVCFCYDYDVIGNLVVSKSEYMK